MMNKTHFKPFSAKKTMLVILGAIFFILLLLGTVSALNIDDVKYYDETTTTYTLENFFGLGKHIADLELKTPQMFEVPRGYQRVAEIEIRNGGYDYEKIINGIKLYNIKDDMNEVVRNVDYKYKTIVQVPDYETICDKGFSANGTAINTNCRQEQVGLKDKVIWEDFTRNSLLKGEIITLRLFTDVQKGDKVEWVLNVYGNERLTKWAGFSESMKVDLEHYWDLDEQDTSGTGVILDSLFTMNGTNAGADNITGKLNTAYDFETVETDWIELGNESGFGIFSISVWVKQETSPNHFVFAKDDDAVRGFAMGISPSGGIYMEIGGTGTSSTKDILVGSWQHLVVTFDENTDVLQFYINNSQENASRTSNPVTYFINYSIKIKWRTRKLSSPYI